MSAGSSIPVQVLQGCRRASSSRGWRHWMDAVAGERLAVFAPFTGTRRRMSDAGEAIVRRSAICC